MVTQIEPAELLTLQACDLKIEGEKMTWQEAMAKYYLSEAVVKVSTETVRIFGGCSYTENFS